MRLFSQDQVLLKGIILTSEIRDLSIKEKFGVTNLVDDFLPKNGELQAELKQFISRPINKELISQIRDKIDLFYKDNGQTFILIEIPKQDVTDGIIVFLVQAPKVGKIDYKGNFYFTTEQLKKRFKLNSQSLLFQSDLVNAVAFNNKNPMRRVELIFRPTKDPKVIDVEYQSLARSPLRVYVGFDNTGNDSTGNNRLYTGINWGNAFWLGDLLTYQYTCNPTLDKFQSHFGQYISYLPWQDVVMLWGGYANTNPDSNSDFFNEGQSGSASFRYQVPFKPFYGDFFQQVSFGIDWKYTNSNVFFGELDLPIVQKAVNLFEAVFDYDFSWSKGNNTLGFSTQLHIQPWTPLPNMNAASYDQLRPGAKPYYGFLLATISNDYQFSNRSKFSSNFRFQVSTTALLPMQQLSLGGYNSVRGYDEQAYLADDAILMNLEYRFPSFSFSKKLKDLMSFLVFLDFGFGHTIKKEGGLDTNEYLFGIGPGLRYYLNNNLALRLDYGFRLHNIPYDTNSIGKVHFGAQLSF